MRTSAGGWPDGGSWRRTAWALAIGAVLGVLLLHPVTMVVYWLEFRADLSHNWSTVWHFIGDRMTASFTLRMAPMTALFAGLGALFGAVYAAVDGKLRRSTRTISRLEHEIARDVPTLIGLGESEHIEFKATARWDLHQGKVNKALADVLAKTIADLPTTMAGASSSVSATTAGSWDSTSIITR